MGKDVKQPMEALDFAVKVKSIIVSVYSHGTEEAAQEVGRLYLQQLCIFKKQLFDLQEQIDLLKRPA